MVLDECPKLTMDKKIISNAIDTSTDWAKRSKIEFNNEKNKSLFWNCSRRSFSMILEIRKFRKAIEIGFDGYALGGLGCW